MGRGRGGGVVCRVEGWLVVEGTGELVVLLVEGGGG